jgi:hypothetical protein
MSYSPVILIEVVLVFGSALAWGLYQLYQLRSEPRRTSRDDEPPPAPAEEPTPAPETPAAAAAAAPPPADEPPRTP